MVVVDPERPVALPRLGDTEEMTDTEDVELLTATTRHRRARMAMGDVPHHRRCRRRLRVMAPIAETDANRDLAEQEHGAVRVRWRHPEGDYPPPCGDSGRICGWIREAPCSGRSLATYTVSSSDSAITYGSARSSQRRLRLAVQFESIRLLPV